MLIELVDTVFGAPDKFSDSVRAAVVESGLVLIPTAEEEPVLGGAVSEEPPVFEEL